jgi:succinyl-diaminopimelate desuccinylase
METVQLLKKLIAAGAEPHCGQITCAKTLKDYFNNHQIASYIEPVEHNRANFILHIPSQRQKNAIMLLAHLDVVPANENIWSTPPFQPTIKENKLFARGAADMKGPIAAAAAAITEIKKSEKILAGDLIFAATAGEETDSAGIMKFMETAKEKLPPLQGIIITEPTDFKTINAHRGMLWLEITTIGKAVHSSMPEKGINAIQSMQKLLEKILNIKLPKPDQLLGKTTISVNRINAGQANNIVPDKCTAVLDIRTTTQTSHQKIIQKINSLIENLKKNDPEFDAKISKTLRSVESLKTDEKSGFIKEFCRITQSTPKTVGFATDGPHLEKLNTPIVIFGPGKPEICHQKDEYIDLQDIEKAKNTYKKIISELLT